MTPAEQEARQRHPAGKKRPTVPIVDILEQLAKTVEACHYLYGVTSADAGSRQERWDLRSMLDYAVMSASHPSDYTVFYYRRSIVQQVLLDQFNADNPLTEFMENFGDWRMWETHRDRTTNDILRVVQNALQTHRKATT